MAGILVTTPIETGPSSNVYLIGEAALGSRTSSEPHKKEANYRQADPIPRITEPTVLAPEKVIGRPETRPGPKQGQLALDRVRGVVDEVEGPVSKVTIFYDERENRFLFPTIELDSAGAAYPGAIFEVIMERSGEYWESRIVHRADEEEKFRSNLLPPDLSFLDEI